MSRSRRRTTAAVSLFPFLAVLMCAMGALILLLIVTTRRIRKEAMADLRQAETNQPEPVAVSSPPPPEPAVVPKVPALAPVRESPPETDRVLAGYRRSVEKTNEDRRAELQRLQAEFARLNQKRDQTAKSLQAAEKRLRAAREKLAALKDSQRKLSGTSASASDRVAELQQDVRTLAANIDAARRRLQELKRQQAEASSRFAIIPFDGRTGTTRRPIFVECTKSSLRILPEDVEISAQDLSGFTRSYNPLLAGVKRLVDYWAAKNRISGGTEPEPYVLLLVRPGGSVAYYAARKMLRSLNRPIGYELITDDWELELPEVDPKAQAVCRLAVEQLLREKRGVVASLKPGGGDGFGRGRRPTASGRRKGRTMRFNRSTGRFEVVEPDDQPALGPFGQAVTGKRSTRSFQPPSEGRPSMKGKPGTGRQTTGRRPARIGRQPADSSGRRMVSLPRKTMSPSGAGTSRLPAARSSSQTGTKGNDREGTDLGSTNQLDPPASASGKTKRLWPLKETTDVDDVFGDAGGRRNSGRRGEAGNPPGDAGRVPRDATRGRPDATRGRGETTHGISDRGLVKGNTQGGRDAGRSTRNATRGRQRRWGFSDPSASIGFEREIRIVATVDRLVVQDRRTIPVGKGETREELFRRVLLAVEQEVQSWGKPPSSFYWVPSIRFVISPGGNRHFSRLKTPLRKAGLQPVAEYRLETPTSQSGSR